jgi:hypothetical protein
VSTCLAGPGVIFLRAGALQACCVLLHPCLRILLAIYSEATAAGMRQIVCTAVSQLRSGQLIPLHHSAYLLYMSIFLVYTAAGAHWMVISWRGTRTVADALTDTCPKLMTD